MKIKIDIDQWVRKDHFLFFSTFEEPFFGVTVQIDCTEAYRKAKEQGWSFFLYYLYRALKASNEIENFRYTIEDGQVYLLDRIDASPTIARPNGTFAFGYMDYDADEDMFYQKALAVAEEVRNSTRLMPSVTGKYVIHFSAIPWIDFTSISHARGFSFPDSAPKISFGKVTETNGKKTMPVSVHVHHGLADGYHVGLFIERFQSLMDG